MRRAVIGRQPERDGHVGGLDGLVLLDGLVGGAAQRRGQVQRDREDDVHRSLALDAERIETGEQPLQREPDTGGALGAVDRFDLALLAVALNRAAQAHHQGNGIADAVGLIIADRARLFLSSGEQPRDRFCQLGAHLLGCMRRHGRGRG